jgi:hypothetical protein
MKKFFRLLARVRFWKHRALKAEQRCIHLIEQYEVEIQELKESNDAEMWRNREREDELITVPQRLQGLWGMPPRSEPAIAAKRRHVPKQLTQSADPWDSLSWADKAEFDMYWKADAEAAGVSLPQARQRFLQEVVIPRRQPLMDDAPSN